MFHLKRHNIYRTFAWLMCLVCCAAVRAGNVIPLWDDPSLRQSDVSLTPFIADNAATDSLHTVVIVCPGGSYSWLDWETEGVGVAQWLQSQGISAFVLRYRVQGVFSFISRFRYIVRGNQFPDALQDLQQAILYLRTHASEFGFQSVRLGVMGFSAGGHLVLSAGTLSHHPSIRPDFIVPVYPVVTMHNEQYTHKRSRRALLGERRKEREVWQDSMSVENHIKADMPPVFLVNCVDDPVVHYRNSELLDSALTYHGIPHEYHQYRTGGHGFGVDASKTTRECIVWKDAFLLWLHNLDL